VEVILKESIEGLGQADEVVRVRPGRARNHLVPERLATYVNAEKLAAAQERLARREEERAESEEDEESEAVSAAEAERARKVSGYFSFFRRMWWTRYRWRSFKACEMHLQ
jgi:large subunit ribosomal protein L9